MTLAQQVCSLELSKRLKELGVKQDSHFVWYRNGDSAHLIDCPDGMRPMEEKSFSAFTVAELGEMLPNGYCTFKTNPEWSFHKVNEPWFCEDDSSSFEKTANTEADARAKMLVYLLENNLTTI